MQIEVPQEENESDSVGEVADKCLGVAAWVESQGEGNKSWSYGDKWVFFSKYKFKKLKNGNEKVKKKGISKYFIILISSQIFLYNNS